jgi:hypothetical protein
MGNVLMCLPKSNLENPAHERQAALDGAKQHSLGSFLRIALRGQKLNDKASGR